MLRNIRSCQIPFYSTLTLIVLYKKREREREREREKKQNSISLWVVYTRSSLPYAGTKRSGGQFCPGAVTSPYARERQRERER